MSREMKKMLFLGMAALAVGLWLAPQQATAALPNAGTRDLYIVSTDGFAYVPDNGDGTAGLDLTRVKRQPLGFQDAPGWIKVWIRGFAAANGPNRANPANGLYEESTTTGASGGLWVPPINRLGKATLPAPILDVDQGDDVFLHLANIGNIAQTAPADPHTVHLHGQTVTTQNDGFPESSWVVPVGSQATYYFFAENAGSSMYHCHVEASEHVQMGMYGVIIVRPNNWRNDTVNSKTVASIHNLAGQLMPGKVFNGPTSYNDEYDAGSEMIFLQSDLDPSWHEQVRTTTNPLSAAAKYKPNYWLINGRSFPDTLGPTVVTQVNGWSIPAVGRYATGAYQSLLGPALLGTGPNPYAFNINNYGINVAAVNAIFGANVWRPAQGPGDGPPDGFLPGANNVLTYSTILDMPGMNANPTAGGRGLVRFVDMGFVPTTMHFHGWHYTAVGIDMNPVPVGSQRKEFTTFGGSGKTFDLIINATTRAGLTGSLYAGQSPPDPGVPQGAVPTPATPARFTASVAGGLASFATTPTTTGVLPPGFFGNYLSDPKAEGYEMGALPTGEAGKLTIKGNSAGKAVAIPTNRGPFGFGTDALQPGTTLISTNAIAGQYVRVDAPVDVKMVGAAHIYGLVNPSNYPNGSPPMSLGLAPAACVGDVCPVAVNINPFPVPQDVTDYWFPSHDHFDYKVTNNGLYPGGAIMLIHGH